MNFYISWLWATLGFLSSKWSVSILKASLLLTSFCQRRQKCLECFSYLCWLQSVSLKRFSEVSVLFLPVLALYACRYYEMLYSRYYELLYSNHSAFPYFLCLVPTNFCLVWMHTRIHTHHLKGQSIFSKTCYLKAIRLSEKSLFLEYFNVWIIIFLNWFHGIHLCMVSLNKSQAWRKSIRRACYPLPGSLSQFCVFF